MTNLNYKIVVPKNLDLVITGGGGVGGSYGLGVLKFIKELENKNIVKINSISGSSIGTILGAHYLNDSLDTFEQISNEIYFKIKKTKNINKETKIIFKKKYNNFDLDKINTKLFIKYIKNNKYFVKNTFLNVEELIENMYNSCSIPYFFENSVFNKNNCCDCILPSLKLENINEQYNKLYIPLPLNNALQTNFNNDIDSKINEGYENCKLFFLSNNSNYFNFRSLSYISNWSIFDVFMYRLLESFIIIFIVILNICITNFSFCIPCVIANSIQTFWLDIVLYKSFI